MSNPVYATLSDLTNYGAPAKAFTGLSNATQTAALVAASRTADGYLKNAFTLPLTYWSEDLTDAVCAIATWRLLASVRGFNPEASSNNTYYMRRQEAEAWLKLVGEREISPVFIDSNPTGKAQTPFTAQGIVQPGGVSGTSAPLFVVGAPIPRGW